MDKDAEAEGVGAGSGIDVHESHAVGKLEGGFGQP